MAGERTEQATPHRREKARQDGDVLVSKELTSAAGLLAGTIALGTVGSAFLSSWTASYCAFLELGRPRHWEDSTWLPTMIALRRVTLTVLAPAATVAFAVAAAALLVAIAQAGGITVRPAAVGFKLDRVNPLSNLKNLFSLRAAARLAKSLLPASLVGILAVQHIGSQLRLPPFSVERLNGLGHEVYGLLLAASLVLFGWAAVDYVVEWQSRENRLKMSREDMREEMRDTEGNPQIRGRIRNLQRQLRRRRVKADVSRAAVVITNPTHYAVALSFDFVTMDAPKVLAKGRDLLAEEIKQEARWAGVPILENPPLARSLYRLVEAGQAIPIDLYAAVASILAYLYRQRVERELRERRSRESQARSRQASSRPAGAAGPMRASQTSASQTRASQTSDAARAAARRGGSGFSAVSAAPAQSANNSTNRSTDDSTGSTGSTTGTREAGVDESIADQTVDSATGPASASQTTNTAPGATANRRLARLAPPTVNETDVEGSQPENPDQNGEIR